jgi:hypothetical protein
MGVLAAPMTNPHHVIELSPDHVFRFWFASTDDLSQRYIICEGSWKIDNGKLQIEDMARSSPRRLMSDIGWQIEAMSGRSLRSLGLYAPHRIWDPKEETFRFAGASQLEVMSHQGKALTWKLLPGWKR